MADSALSRRGWTRKIPEVPSNLSHSVVLYNWEDKLKSTRDSIFDQILLHNRNLMASSVKLWNPCFSKIFIFHFPILKGLSLEGSNPSCFLGALLFTSQSLKCRSQRLLHVTAALTHTPLTPELGLALAVSLEVTLSQWISAGFQSCLLLPYITHPALPL